MFTIHADIDIAAPLARVHAALSSEAGFRAWFAEDADFDGLRATFRFPQPNEVRSVTFDVARCDDRIIAMTCTAHENNPDWLGTELTFALTEIPTGTRVQLTHAGYPARNEVYERCSEAWPHFLRSLATYMTTGAGAPYPKVG